MFWFTEKSTEATGVTGVEGREARLAVFTGTHLDGSKQTPLYGASGKDF